MTETVVPLLDVQDLLAGIVDVDSDPAAAPIDVAFTGGVHFTVELAPGFSLLR